MYEHVFMYGENNEIVTVVHLSELLLDPQKYIFSILLEEGFKINDNDNELYVLK